MIMAKVKITKFGNGGMIIGYNDWEEMVEYVTSLSKFDLTGVGKGLLLYPRSARFYFHHRFGWSTFLGFQTILYSLFHD